MELAGKAATNPSIVVRSKKAGEKVNMVSSHVTLSQFLNGPGDEGHHARRGRRKGGPMSIPLSRLHDTCPQIFRFIGRNYPPFCGQPPDELHLMVVYKLSILLPAWHNDRDLPSLQDMKECPSPCVRNN